MFAILGIVLFIASLFLYYAVISPYVTAIKIKRRFEQKGYKVYLQKLNFFRERYHQKILQNTKRYKNSQYDFQHKYRGYDVVIHNSLNKIFVWIVNIDLLKDVFNQIQKLQKIVPVKNSLKRMYGGGLPVSQGKQWKIKRKLYAEIFNFKLLQQLHPYIQEVVQKQLQKRKTNQKVDVLQYLREVTFNIFVQSYFGCQFDSFNYKNEKYSTAVIEIFDKIHYQAFDWKHLLFGTKVLDLGLTAKDRQINEQMKVIKSQTKKFLTKKFEQIQQNKSISEHNILSKLVFNDYFKNCSPQEKEKKLEEITGDVLVFFFAGTDTTTVTLATTLHVLKKHPQLQQKILDQLKEIKNLSDPHELKKLKYLDAVMNQALRLYGPANTFLLRQITNDSIRINDVLLPKGIYFGFEAVTIHTSEKYYENPFQFMPERWLKQKVLQNPFCFVPFGSGARNCIGQHLARIQYKIILAKILQKYKFTTEDQLILKQIIILAPTNNSFVFSKRQISP